MRVIQSQLTDKLIIKRKGFVCFGDFVESSLRKWHNWNVEKRQDNSHLNPEGFGLWLILQHTPPPKNPHKDIFLSTSMFRPEALERPVLQFPLQASVPCGGDIRTAATPGTNLSLCIISMGLVLSFLKSDPVSDPLTFTRGSLIS